MKRSLRILVGLACLLGAVYFVGPHPARPIYGKVMPYIPANHDSLDRYVDSSECQHDLKKDNAARIVWYDSTEQKTDYAIVYLHGFSASQEEGNPAHRTIARMFGCNLYLSRLAEHGIDTVEQLLNLTPENYWESAKEALAVGTQLGKKVILMGSSTGGTQALQLAAAFPDDVAGLILYSPNIAINDNKAWILNQPWGLQIARLVKHGNYLVAPDNRPIYKQYWNTPYRLEALVSLEEMLSTTMTEETFKVIHQPTLALYYYKNEQEQDTVVRVGDIKRMMERIATPDNLKRAVAMPNAGDHILGSPIKSKDVAGVIDETKKFLIEVMKLKVISDKL